MKKSEFNMWLLMANNEQKNQAVEDYKKDIASLTNQIIEIARRAEQILTSMNPKNTQNG